MQNTLPIASDMTKAAQRSTLITGGAGFIGSAFLKLLMLNGKTCINLDALTYAGCAFTEVSSPHCFIHGDIRDAEVVSQILRERPVTTVVHFAAESHVDRSITGPLKFIDTNVVGTATLLQACLQYWNGLPKTDQKDFRFIHISTDEVYGSLGSLEPAFTEVHPYRPNSPYAASKAASDHIARAYYQTYGFPVITTHCSNNYGPLQFPEKLIPLCLQNALTGKELPIYGDGKQIRDWLYVEDHCAAIQCVLEAGIPGEVYNIGGWNEKTNLEVVHALCAILDEERPRADGRSYAEQITFVKDRPGHDRRYAIDASKIERELGWRPQETFETGIRKTVRWYLDNQDWVANVTSGAYRQWIDRQYAGN